MNKEQPHILKMEESSFFERAQKHLPVKIVDKKWENNALMIYFYYL